MLECLNGTNEFANFGHTITMLKTLNELVKVGVENEAELILQEQLDQRDSEIWQLKSELAIK